MDHRNRLCNRRSDCDFEGVVVHGDDVDAGGEAVGGAEAGVDLCAVEVGDGYVFAGVGDCQH